MTKQKRQRRSTTQRLLWLLSLFLVGSMVISLFVVAFPGVMGSPETPTPTDTPRPSPTPSPTSPAASPGMTPVMGPERPTETPAP